MDKAALVIIFNHKYNKNIPELQNIYKNNFSNIIYLVPFFRENEMYQEEYNIETVYSSSYTFQAYIAQSIKSIMDRMVTHYIFIGDDLFLHPAINEYNYKEFFAVSAEDSFITELFPINQCFERYTWKFSRVHEILSRIQGNRFVNALQELPSIDQAYGLSGEKGFSDFKMAGGSYFASGNVLTKTQCKIWDWSMSKKRQYPVFGGYSDLLLIPRPEMEEFAHYCGVLGAMDIFVESAIPTSMVLACKKIKTIKDTSYERGDIWGMENKEDFGKKYGFDLQRLFGEWPQNLLFTHPVKLSQWQTGKS